MPISRALLSVSDKTGLVPLAQALADRGVELISTGGTAQALKDAGFKVTTVSDLTGFPEIMGGRVKTLHPKVHGALLGMRDNPVHTQEAAANEIEPIDLVVVNLYPFEATVARSGVTLEEAIENIDIGGPSMLRSAAKNHKHVTVLTDPEDYPDFLKVLEENDGKVPSVFRARCARRVFALTARYDGAISSFLQAHATPDEPARSYHRTFERVDILRYGENPHQKAALYRPAGMDPAGIAGGELVNGKAMSYNNWLDADAAWALVREFDDIACAVIKHTNPCGCALGRTPSEAFNRAWEGDPVSAFGSIIAFNRPVEAETAEEIVSGKRFVEVIVAPGFSGEAIEILSGRKGWGADLRLLEVRRTAPAQPLVRTLDGGLLIQDADLEVAERYESVSREPTPAELSSLKFAWKVCKHVKSNAIAVARDNQLLGAGAGQMNRVQSVDLAITQAGDRLDGAVLASDAFFPFRDSVDVAARAGIRALIQPGGSKKDPEVIAACKEHDIALVLTGMRHFRHG